MTPSIVVIGLGPGDGDLLTRATLDLIAAEPRIYLRTARHPAASVVQSGVAEVISFDDVYERCLTFDEVYATIVESLIAAAGLHGRIVYAVPGSPMVAEHTVELLVADPRVDVTLVPALSFLDLTWVRLGIDPLAAGVRIVDGHRFADEAAGERGPLLVSQCHSRAVLSDIKLSIDTDVLHPAELPQVTVLQRLGLPDEHIFTVAWNDLDRTVVPDHLTSLWIPRTVPTVASEMTQLHHTMQALRDGCPWDAEQTHPSLARYAIEEAYELAEAIDALEHDDSPALVDHLVEELGDVLFQVVFHACLGEESGSFTLADVARTLRTKLVHRHPHVFADLEVSSSQDVVRNWELIKAGEREAKGLGADGPMSGLTEGLPALSYASKVIKRAQAAGHTVDTGGSESSESSDRDDIGAALLSLVAAARTAGVDPEEALRLAATRLRDTVIRST